MAQVIVGKSLESAIRHLNRMCEKELVFIKLKEREFYKKPSTVRHEKRKRGSSTKHKNRRGTR